MCDYSRKPVKWQVGNFSHLILTVDNRLQFMQYDLPEKQSERTFEYVNNILFAVNKISNL